MEPQIFKKHTYQSNERNKELQLFSLNITFSFARDLMIIGESSIKKNLVHFENAILLITEE